MPTRSLQRPRGAHALPASKRDKFSFASASRNLYSMVAWNLFLLFLFHVMHCVWYEYTYRDDHGVTYLWLHFRVGWLYSCIHATWLCSVDFCVLNCFICTMLIILCTVLIFIVLCLKLILLKSGCYHQNGTCVILQMCRFILVFVVAFSQLAML